MKGVLYDYKGQKLYQAEIARLEGVSRTTLADWYKKTNDIMLAKEHLRHSSVKITEQHYVHIEEDDLARAVCGV